MAPGPRLQLFSSTQGQPRRKYRRAQRGRRDVACPNRNSRRPLSRPIIIPKVMSSRLWLPRPLPFSRRAFQLVRITREGHGAVEHLNANAWQGLPTWNYLTTNGYPVALSALRPNIRELRCAELHQLAALYRRWRRACCRGNAARKPSQFCIRPETGNIRSLEITPHRIDLFP